MPRLKAAAVQSLEVAPLQQLAFSSPMAKQAYNEKAAAELQATYDRHAAVWHAKRQRDVPGETAWLQRTAEGLPKGARILDLGCGSGEPAGRFFLHRGHDVTGYDLSPAMIDLARASYPSGAWHVGDMRSLDHQGPFDAVIGWDSFFHLSTDDQRVLLPELASLVADQGVMLFTVGHDEGAVDGQVFGDVVPHGSLSPQEYRSILETKGFVMELTLHDDTVGGRNVLLARKA